MTIIKMLGQSGLLTLLGMCVVFGFIIILICCMKLLQVIIHAFKLDKDSQTENSSASASPAGSAAPAAGDNGALVAAIAAAVHDKSLNL